MKTINHKYLHAYLIKCDHVEKDLWLYLKIWVLPIRTLVDDLIKILHKSSVWLGNEHDVCPCGNVSQLHVYTRLVSIAVT